MPACGQIELPADLSHEGRPQRGHGRSVAVDLASRRRVCHLDHSPGHSCGTAPDSTARHVTYRAVPPASRFKPWLPDLRAPLLGQGIPLYSPRWLWASILAPNTMDVKSSFWHIQPLITNVNRRPKRRSRRSTGMPNNTINSTFPAARPMSHHDEVTA